jgi:hypothetical protein
MVETMRQTDGVVAVTRRLDRSALGYSEERREGAARVRATGDPRLWPLATAGTFRRDRRSASTPMFPVRFHSLDVPADSIRCALAASKGAAMVLASRPTWESAAPARVTRSGASAAKRLARHGLTGHLDISMITEMTEPMTQARRAVQGFSPRPNRSHFRVCPEVGTTAAAVLPMSV